MEDPIVTAKNRVWTLNFQYLEALQYDKITPEQLLELRFEILYSTKELVRLTNEKLLAAESESIFTGKSCDAEKADYDYAFKQLISATFNVTDKS
jgi:hypothetical protein